MEKNKPNLPTLKDLHRDLDEAYKDDQFNLLLNQPPHEKWVKKHPLYKVKNEKGENVPWEFLPIDKIEYLILRIFGQFRIEIKDIKPVFNSMLAIIRLWVLHPVTGEWTYHDGTGAAPIQTDAGFSAADLSHIKAGAVQMGAPAAVSYAIKDAAEHFGKLFGRDLNKKTLMFTAAFEKPEQPQTASTPRTDEDESGVAY